MNIYSKKNMNAVVYLRASEDLARDGVIDRQRRECERVAARYGLTIVCVYVDIGPAGLYRQGCGSMNWLHLHPRSWEVDDVELVAAVPFVGYFFRAVLHCRSCGRVRTTMYLDSILILRLAYMGVRDPSYQKKALEIAEQMRIDGGASLF